MIFQELSIKGAWLAETNVHSDSRGLFREWFKPEEFKSISKIDFRVMQCNTSTSRKNVIRGIHYSLSKEGQAKWVTCTNGRVWDVIVDLRIESATFKQWIGIEISSTEGQSIYLSEGLGHAFLALEDNSTVAYLLSSEYNPEFEYEIHYNDSDIKITWPDLEFQLSEKDLSASTLAQMLSGNLLP